MRNFSRAGASRREKKQNAARKVLLAWFAGHRGGKQVDGTKIPLHDRQSLALPSLTAWPGKATRSCSTAANVEKLKTLPDFEGREEPALAEDFLRFRVETWADILADAGAAPGEVSVSVDPHQRKAHLIRRETLFSATSDRELAAPRSPGQSQVSGLLTAGLPT